MSDVARIEIRCSACGGTGSIESDDSTDDGWWDCSLCKGSGLRVIPDRRVDRYPRAEGDTVVLGPEIFASADGETICWKGVNYVKQGLAR